MAAIGLRKYMDYRIEKDASVEGKENFCHWVGNTEPVDWVIIPFPTSVL